MLKRKVLKSLLFNFYCNKTIRILGQCSLLFVWYIVPVIVMSQPYENINVTVSGWVHNVEGVPDTQMYRAPLLDGITLTIRLEYEYYSVEKNNMVSDYESQTIISGYGSLGKGQFIASFDITLQSKVLLA